MTKDRQDLPDISYDADIIALVDDFYAKALVDQTLSPIFLNHMNDSIQEHLPVIYSFWQSVLLGTQSYRGNIMLKHIELNQRIKLTKVHFENWLALWEESVDRNYSGPKADEAKQRAKAMKELMLYKIQKSKDSNSIL